MYFCMFAWMYEEMISSICQYARIKPVYTFIQCICISNCVDNTDIL